MTSWNEQCRVRIKSPVPAFELVVKIDLPTSMTDTPVGDLGIVACIKFLGESDRNCSDGDPLNLALALHL